MRKWIGPCLVFLVILVSLSLSGPFEHGPRGKEPLVLSTQSRDNKDDDSHMIQLLKSVQEMLDGWLKSLNERIDREDVTRFEVRFLEILRSILEWTKEKVDRKLDSLREQQQRRERGTFRDAHGKGLPFS
jgi:hypothetical protein